MIDFEKERSQTWYIYHQFDTNLTFGLNIHNSYEFIFLYEGEIFVQINNKTFTLTPNTAALILPGQIHSFETVSWSKSYICVFSADYVNDFSDQIKNFELVNPVFKFGDSEFIELFIDKNSDKLIHKAFLYLVCGLAAKAGLKPTNHSEDSQLIYKIIDYVNNNYKYDVSLKQMAHDLGYNYTYLSNLFNRLLGSHYSIFINQCRVNAAKRMLRDTSLQMSDIAIQCGFVTIRNFNRAFLKIEHTSPKEFRARARKMQALFQ